ncbi:MAG TPA: WG repeat-containing protein, partial [Leptospiraceae bacterium]|nr:WG repeat-containing protein [Leptospiraceae bacterium]
MKNTELLISLFSLLYLMPLLFGAVLADPISETETVRSKFKDQYDEIVFLNFGLYSVRKGEKTGFYDINTDKIIADIIYDKDSFGTGFAETDRKEYYLAEVCRGGKCALIDSKGKELTEFKYDRIEVHNIRYGHISADAGKKQAVLNLKGEEVIPAVYSLISAPMEGVSSVTVKNDKGLFGVYDLEKRKETVPCIYEQIQIFNSGYQYAVQKAGKWGLMSSDGVLLVKIHYDEIQYKEYGIYAVRIGEKEGFYSSAKKKMISEVRFDRYSSFYGFKETPKKGYAVTEVFLKEKGALMDSTGKILTEFKYGRIDSLNYRSGYFFAEIKKKQGLLKYDGTETVPVVYSNISVPSEKHSLVEIQKGKKSGVFDLKKGEEIIPCDYSQIQISEDGKYIFALQKKKWGVLSLKNETVIPFEYIELRRHHQGMFSVKGKDGWKFVNRKNVQVGRYKYEDIDYRYSGQGWDKLSLNTILVKRTGLWGTVDEKGEELIVPKYDKDFVFYEDRCGTADTALAGHPVFINTKGEVIAAQKEPYEEVTGFSRDCTARAKIKGKYGVINKEGKIIIPFQYENLGVNQDYWFGMDYYTSLGGLPAVVSG